MKTLTSFEEFQQKQIDSLNKQLEESVKRNEELSKQVGDLQVKLHNQELVYNLQYERISNKLTQI